MNVGRKLMLIVVSSVALVTLPAVGILYQFTKTSRLHIEANNLVGETQSIISSHTQSLMQTEPSLNALSRILEKSLAGTIQPGEEAAFAQVMQHDSDGAWRNKLSNFNGKYEAGVFMPPDAPLTSEQKIFHLRSKRVLDVFGGSVNDPFSNVWLLTQGKTEIIYDHGVPDFAQIMAPDTDYTQTDWVTLGDPANNPKREIRWTPPLFDPVPKSWMISAVKPLDVNGRWVGTIGHDIYLYNVFPLLFQKNQRYEGEVHFLLDAKGNFIQAGPWQKELEAKPESFKPDFSQENDLSQLLASKLSLDAKAFDHQISLKGRRYIAVGMLMQPVDWRYFRLIPTDEILAPTQNIIIVLTLMILAIGLLIGFTIETSAKRNIISRLQSLADAMRNYSDGNLASRAHLSGNDEIAKAAGEFNAMAEHNKATLEAIPDLFFDLDLNGRIYACHAPVNSLLAVPAEQLIDKNIREVMPESVVTVVFSALQEANQHGISYGAQYEMLLPQNNHWFEISIARKSGNADQVRRFIALARDITERKHAAQKLVKAKEIAEAANRAKSQFIGNMSHELRTPMFGVLGLAEMLAESDVTEETRIDYAKIIMTSGTILMNLLNDILDVSKIDAGKITLESTEMAPATIIDDVQALFSANILKKGLKIESAWNGPSELYLADSHRLTQMLSNLVGNAVKFTQKGSIRIEAREVAHSESAVQLEFSVTDTGIGIAADKQTLLFQPFTQVDSSDTRNHDGAGLGLSIVRKLAELMGGEAGVESEVGKGSRFWFRVQVKRIA